MKNIVKKIGLISIIMILTVLFNSIKSNAALQANGGAPVTKSLTDWLTQVRQMQAQGGTLGRTDNIDGTSLKSDSTDIDIHMEKNTEYGAMAILSASSYGNPNKIENGGTTTGNNTGIVININKEWVAAGQLASVGTFTNAASRYKNYYTTTYVAKTGDAITETNGWHGSTESTWLSGSTVSMVWDAYRSYNGAGLLRSYSGSLFSYYGLCNSYYGNSGSRDGNAGYNQAGYYGKAWASRAAVVCGPGI